MKARKTKHKSRKGLLAPQNVAGVSHKAKQKSPTVANPVAKLQGSASKGPSTVTVHPQAEKIDKYTGKKQGTLFSAAPSPGFDQAENRSRRPSCKPQRKGKQQVHLKASSVMPDEADSSRSQAQTGSPAIATGKHKKRKRDALKHAKSGTVVNAQATTAASELKQATGKNNWERLKTEALLQSVCLPTESKSLPRNFPKRKQRAAAQDAGKVGAGFSCADGISDGKLVAKNADMRVTDVLALDCEMVGVGQQDGRKRDALARAILVRCQTLCICICTCPSRKVQQFEKENARIVTCSLSKGLLEVDENASACRSMTVVTSCWMYGSDRKRR
jgi:hypothetical protein